MILRYLTDGRCWNLNPALLPFSFFYAALFAAQWTETTTNASCWQKNDIYYTVLKIHLMHMRQQIKLLLQLHIYCLSRFSIDQLSRFSSTINVFRSTLYEICMKQKHHSRINLDNLAKLKLDPCIPWIHHHKHSAKPWTHVSKDYLDLHNKC